MAPAVKYVVPPERVTQLEGQKKGITRFGSTGDHDILERTMKNTEQWVKLRFSLWYWLTSIGNVFKTCHDAADTEANGKIKERRRSGKVNTVAHEVYGPGNQINEAADGSEGDGTGQASNRNLRMALQALWPSNWHGISLWRTWSLATCCRERSRWQKASPQTR